MSVRKLLPLLVLFGFCACDKDPDPLPTCNTEYPISDLPWLKARIDQLEDSGQSQYTYITLGKYRGQPVFLFGSCCEECTTENVVYDCSGSKVGIPGDGFGKINYRKITILRKLYGGCG